MRHSNYVYYLASVNPILVIFTTNIQNNFFVLESGRMILLLAYSQASTESTIYESGDGNLTLEKVLKYSGWNLR